MTTLLAPTYSLRIGSQIWKEQLLRLELTLTAAPGIDILSAVLPALAPLDAAVDDDVELTLDSGEQGDKVFTGVVAVIRRSHAAIDVKAVNAGGVLCRYRPAATYENATRPTSASRLDRSRPAQSSPTTSPIPPARPGITSAGSAAGVAPWSRFRPRTRWS
jgi:hypothetical protein